MASVVTRVSLIATVLNERERLDEWLAGLERQTRQADEVVIVDGGSTDGTWQRLREWRPSTSVRVLQRCGASISQGRNVAIEASCGEIIAVTDAGTVADPRWLERLVAEFDDPCVDVAAGFFRPALESRWERALAAVTLPDPGEIDPERFLPSSRSLAFRRAWVDAGLRYPDWLDYCEDVVWDLAMRRAGARFVFVSDAVVTFCVRQSAASHFRQYQQYARGDGKAGLFARRHVARYASYAVGALVLARRKPRELRLASLLGMAYLGAPLRRLWRRDRAAGVATRETALTLPLLPALRLLGDAAKMAGYPAGLCWRWRRFGSVGWRTTWRRISPAGALWRPGRLSRRIPPPTASPVVESQAQSR